MKDKRWPSTVCEVVKQRKNAGGKWVCQFSWYCDGKKDVIWANYEKTGETIEGNARAWRESVRMALAVMDLEKTFTVDDNTNGALYYYNHNLVYPYWADHMELIGVLGNHTFMK